MVIFDEEAHTYTNPETGERYISTTTLLGDYKNKFDTEGHATRISKRDGVSKQFIIDEWEKTKDIACAKGTRIHKIMEDHIEGKPIPDGSTKSQLILNEMYSSYDQLVKQCVPDRSHKDTYSEMILSLDKYKLAGMADIVYDCNKYFYIGDFKTNKAFKFTSQYDEFLLPPVDHLTSCEFNNYTLQLSIYAYMYEQETGKKCKGLIVYYLEGTTWRSIACNYLKSDVINILENYRLSTK